MPIHVYVCPKCSQEMDVEFSYREPMPNEFPKCSRCNTTMIRSWNDTLVHFKGRGFYANDSKKETDR